MGHHLYKILLDLFRRVDFMAGLAKPLAALSVIVAILLVAWLAFLITRYILNHWILKIVRKTRTEWDDILVRNKVFNALAHLVPLFIIYNSAYFATPVPDIPMGEYGADEAALMLADYYFSLGPFLMKIAHIYFVFTFAYIAVKFLNAVNEIYMTGPYAMHRPIKGYLQLVQILIAFLAVIIVIAILIGKDPSVLIAGLGAIAAVLMLIFKDTILGFVASIQLSVNDMLKLGDWIEMPGRNTDGTVLDISLTTVKVQNWDKTITTIPTYAMVSESFTNWKGMQESEGRRIKRSIFIDMYSIQFCTPKMLEHFKKFEVIRDYVTHMEEEVTRYNQNHHLSEDDVLTGLRQTNIGVFRKYLELYLKKNPLINNQMTFLIRQLQPTEKGLPIEIYVFSKEKVWADYEKLQNDIFDHIFAVIPEFGLKIFQSPAGTDMRSAFQQS